MPKYAGRRRQSRTRLLKEGLDGRSVLRYALGVAAQDALCVSPHWHATVDALTRTPLVTIEPVIATPRAPWRVTDRGHLGDFRDLRQLRSRGRTR